MRNRASLLEGVQPRDRVVVLRSYGFNAIHLGRNKFAIQVRDEAEWEGLPMRVAALARLVFAPRSPHGTLIFKACFMAPGPNAFTPAELIAGHRYEFSQ